jgi:hypothetical protein
VLRIFQRRGCGEKPQNQLNLSKNWQMSSQKLRGWCASWSRMTTTEKMTRPPEVESQQKEATRSSCGNETLQRVSYLGQTSFQRLSQNLFFCLEIASESVGGEADAGDGMQFGTENKMVAGISSRSNGGRSSGATGAAARTDAAMRVSRIQTDFRVQCALDTRITR